MGKGLRGLKGYSWCIAARCMGMWTGYAAWQVVVDPGTCYPSDLHPKIWCLCIFLHLCASLCISVHFCASVCICVRLASAESTFVYLPSFHPEVSVRILVKSTHSDDNYPCGQWDVDVWAILHSFTPSPLHSVNLSRLVRRSYHWCNWRTVSEQGWQCKV